MKSWKTTVGGLIVFLTAIMHELQYVLDDDPTTNFGWSVVIAAAGVFIMGLFARDKNVTSEQEGAK